MKRFATLVLGASSVAASCQTSAIVASGDPYFAWLITGNNEQRAGNVTAICASANNTARTNFNNRLNGLITDCVPAGTDVSTSAFGVIASLLNRVLCEQKTDLGSLRFCVLSMLPLFDPNYLLSLTQGELKIPPLAAVADSVDRLSAMCLSDVCNSFIENLAPALLSTLPATTAAQTAAVFIRGTVSRMRCGCVGTCQSSATANALIDANGAFIESAACDANGMPTQCARNWMACQNTPPPKCAKPCETKTIATVKFTLKNLNYDCFRNNNNVTANIQSDVIANVPGLLQSDFHCSCAAAAAPVTGTTCKCEITCANLRILKDLDLAKELGFLATRANAIAVPTPTLDELLPASCKITANSESFGSSFVLEGAELTPTTEPQTAGASSVALSAFVVLLAAAVF